MWRGVGQALGSSREAVLLRAVAVAFELSDPGQVNKLFRSYLLHLQDRTQQ